MALTLMSLWSPQSYEPLRLASMAHAAAALVAGLSIFLGLIPVWAWLVLQWLWFAWPVVLVAHPSRSFRGVAVPIGVGLLLLLPNAFWLWANTVWSINGFAP